MTNRLDAAIIHLKIYAGIKPVREHEYFSVGYGDTPPVPVRQEDIQAAIRILQAAAKVSPETIDLMLNDGQDWNFSLSEHRELLEEEAEIRALLAALPDDDGTPGEEGGQRP